MMIELSSVDSRNSIGRIHFDEMQTFLRNIPAEKPLNSRSVAQGKLARLTKQQFQELSEDVYDELVRRNNDSELPFFLIKDDPERNQARHKLTTLQLTRFRDLTSDVVFELGQRCPEFQELEVPSILKSLHLLTYRNGPSPAHHRLGDLLTPEYDERSQRQQPPPSTHFFTSSSGGRSSDDRTSTLPAAPVNRRRAPRGAPLGVNHDFLSEPDPLLPLTFNAVQSQPEVDTQRVSQMSQFLGSISGGSSAQTLIVDSKTTPSSSTSSTFQSGTHSSSAYYPGSSDREDVHIVPCPLVLFNKDSEHCLDGRISRTGSSPTTGGGNADIWEGLFGDQKVAIKCIRPFSSHGECLKKDRLLKRLWREYVVWERISHPSILRCLGFTYDHSQGPYSLPSLISPWMPNGTLTQYLASHPDANHFKILLDIAEGLSYLHEQNPPIIHGDIRGNNILISDTGRPCLSDFGLSKVLKLEGFTATSEPGGSVRWMSPELFRGNHLPSPKSDVWAYAMTVLEIMSGRQPYAEVQEAAALFMICQGQLPQRFPDFTDSNIGADDVWTVCQKCWNSEPERRPSMCDVVWELTSLMDGKL